MPFAVRVVLWFLSICEFYGIWAGLVQYSKPNNHPPFKTVLLLNNSRLQESEMDLPSLVRAN